MKRLEEFEENFEHFKIIWLLSELKKAVSGIDGKVNPHLTLHEADANLYRMRQHQGKANNHYLERFRASI